MKTRKNFAGLINERNYTVAVEIGVGHGGYSQYLLSECPKIILYSIDPFINCEEFREGAEKNSREKLTPFGERSKLIIARGIDTAPTFEDNSIDFIYIDGEHTEKAVTEDLNAWWPKLKTGGIMAGHDYNIGGISKAVNEFTAAKSLAIQLTGTELVYDTPYGEECMQPSWWFEVSPITSE